MFDLLLKGGKMVFEIGKPLFRADVVVREANLAKNKELGLNEVEKND